uniref:Uncharacterized protein n=1 Tax=uncultured bacterium EB3 TaxID=1348856 RepID=U3N953_9BACT|nr:hypothetical protein [uncultured bacterium EB3]
MVYGSICISSGNSTCGGAGPAGAPGNPFDGSRDSGAR